MAKRLNWKERKSMVAFKQRLNKKNKKKMAIKDERTFVLLLLLMFGCSREKNVLKLRLLKRFFFLPFRMPFKQFVVHVVRHLVVSGKIEVNYRNHGKLTKTYLNNFCIPFSNPVRRLPYPRPVLPRFLTQI